MDIADPSAAPTKETEHWSFWLFGTWLGRLVWVAAGFAIIPIVQRRCPGWAILAIFVAWSLPLLIASAANTLATVLIGMVKNERTPVPAGQFFHTALMSALEEALVVLAIVALAMVVF